MDILRAPGFLCARDEPLAGRLLTLDDTVEFFNMVLELKLSEQEKQDPGAFMLQLQGCPGKDPHGKTQFNLSSEATG